MYTNEALQALLSHPDAFVRANADWLLQTRRPTWERGQGLAPFRIEDGLTRRLDDLRRAGLESSPMYYL